jgi:gephyrin
LDSLELYPQQVDERLPGHILAEDIIALENIPSVPTTNVDGYALHSSQQPGNYAVVTSVTHPISHRLDIGTVMQVNTGSPIPYGTDAVIMVEDTKLESSKSGSGEEDTITTLKSCSRGDHVRQPGSDVRKGEKVLELGELIEYSGGEMGTLAFVGRAKVRPSLPYAIPR